MEAQDTSVQGKRGPASPSCSARVPLRREGAQGAHEPNPNPSTKSIAPFYAGNGSYA